MTKEEKLALKKDRLKKLESSPKSQGMGVLRKLRRQIYNYESLK